MDYEAHRGMRLLLLSLSTLLPSFPNIFLLYGAFLDFVFNYLLAPFNSWKRFDLSHIEFLFPLLMLVISVIGIHLALATRLLAGSDLEKMRKKLMDPHGKAFTSRALRVARLGLALNSLFTLFAVLIICGMLAS